MEFHVLELQTISQDRQKRLEYEARLKATLDYNQGMYEAEQRGIQKGIRAIISDGLEDNLSKERIVSKLQRHFDLTKKQATLYYTQYTSKV